MSSAAQVYILYSKQKDKYYVGSTVDLAHRLYHHNLGATPSTKTGRPWQVVYTESFADLKTARARERAIKRKKSRRYIEWLIACSEEAQDE